MYYHYPARCIVPPYMLEAMAQNGDGEVRKFAREAVAFMQRSDQQGIEELAPGPSMSPAMIKNRAVYDASKATKLPGSLCRCEGDASSTDDSVNEAYDYAGHTYDFFEQEFGYRLFDGRGMEVISSVHFTDSYGDAVDNAFWNGRQVVYGDGDGTVFGRFTGSIDVVAHELTHGVADFRSKLVYGGQAGTLNEHFADVFGVLVRKWVNLSLEVEDLNWLIGEEVLVAAPTRRAIRDMKNPGTAYTGDPILGTDPQRSDMSGMYSGTQDHGGVHLNSGIPNRAFVLAAEGLGGHPWEKAGQIWFETMAKLGPDSGFAECAHTSAQVALELYGETASQVVLGAWQEVGLEEIGAFV